MVFERELNLEATRKKAKEVLGNYRKLEVIANRKYVSKVTASYSLEAKSFTGVVNKPLEDNLAARDGAERLVQEILFAINVLDDIEFRQILIEKYCKRGFVSNKILMFDLGMGDTEFYRKLNRALVQFATAYRNGELLVYASNSNVDEWVNNLLH